MPFSGSRCSSSVLPEESTDKSRELSRSVTSALPSGVKTRSQGASRPVATTVVSTSTGPASAEPPGCGAPVTSGAGVSLSASSVCVASSAEPSSCCSDDPCPPPPHPAERTTTAARTRREQVKSLFLPSGSDVSRIALIEVRRSTAPPKRTWMVKTCRLYRLSLYRPCLLRQPGEADGHGLESASQALSRSEVGGKGQEGKGASRPFAAGARRGVSGRLRGRGLLLRLPGHGRLPGDGGFALRDLGAVVEQVPQGADARGVPRVRGIALLGAVRRGGVFRGAPRFLSHNRGAPGLERRRVSHPGGELYGPDPGAHLGGNEEGRGREDDIRSSWAPARGGPRRRGARADRCDPAPRRPQRARRSLEVGGAYLLVYSPVDQPEPAHGDH